MMGIAVVEEKHELFDEDYADGNGVVHLFVRAQGDIFQPRRWGNVAFIQEKKGPENTNLACGAYPDGRLRGGCIPEKHAKEVHAVSILVSGDLPTSRAHLLPVKLVLGGGGRTMDPFCPRISLYSGQKAMFDPEFALLEQGECFSVEVGPLIEPLATRRVRVTLHGPWMRPVTEADKLPKETP